MKTRWSFWNWKFKKKEGIWEGSLKTVRTGSNVKQRSRKTVYAISRWSNAHRAAARHIDNGEGKPLCGGAGRKAFSWEQEEGEPTCKRCVRLFQKACK